MDKFITWLKILAITLILLFFYLVGNMQLHENKRLRDLEKRMDRIEFYELVPEMRTTQGIIT
jgi:hypothetical protein